MNNLVNEWNDFRVVGPFVVDRCMKANTRLPKWRHPIYALTMKGAVVCFSGLTKRKKVRREEEENENQCKYSRRC